MTGRGYQIGRARPDIGAGFAELACDSCSATWVGPPMESCYYCAPDAADRRRIASERLHRIDQQMQREAERERQRVLSELGELLL